MLIVIVNNKKNGYKCCKNVILFINFDTSKSKTYIYGFA